MWCQKWSDDGVDHMRSGPPSPGKWNFAPCMMEIFGGSQEMTLSHAYVFCFKKILCRIYLRGQKMEAENLIR